MVINRKHVDGLLTLLIVIFSVVIIYFLILKLTDHSPTDIIILYSFITLLILSMFKVQYDLGGFKEFSQGAKHSFKNIKEDNLEIKREIKEIKELLRK